MMCREIGISNISTHGFIGASLVSYRYRHLLVVFFARPCIEMVVQLSGALENSGSCTRNSDDVSAIQDRLCWSFLCRALSHSNRTSSWPHRATLTMIFDPNQHPPHLLLDGFVDAGMLLDPLEEARPKGGDTSFVVLQLGEQSGVDVRGFAAAEEEGGSIVGLRVVGGRDGAGRRGGEEGEGKR